MSCARIRCRQPRRSLVHSVVLTLSVTLKLLPKSQCFVLPSRPVTTMSRALSSSVVHERGNEGEECVDVDGRRRTFRILALHGKGETAPSFKRALSPLLTELSNKLLVGDGHFTAVECDSIAAPLDGGKWWEQIPEGSRSYEATSYDGYELSASIVRDALSCKPQQQGSSDDAMSPMPYYDVVLGHSQGAILLAAMLANGDFDTDGTDVRDSKLSHSTFPTNFIFNGVAWPNPFGTKLSAHDLQRQGKCIRALFVIGDADTMNPPEGARRVRDALEEAGVKVQTLSHPNGHSVPTGDVEAVKAMVDWMVHSRSA